MANVFRVVHRWILHKASKKFYINVELIKSEVCVCVCVSTVAVLELRNTIY